MIGQIKQFLQAKKSSYEASAVMVVCLLFAAIFTVGAVVTALAEVVGWLQAWMILAASFFGLALIMWLVSRSQQSAAEENIEDVQREAVEGVQAITNTVETVSAEATKPNALMLLTAAIGTLLVAVTYAERR